MGIEIGMFLNDLSKTGWEILTFITFFVAYKINHDLKNEGSKDIEQELI
jgi:hypothetical protein